MVTAALGTPATVDTAPQEAPAGDAPERRARAVVLARTVASLFVVMMLGFGLLPLAHVVSTHRPLWTLVVGVLAFGTVSVSFVRLLNLAVRRPWRHLGRWECGIVVVLALALPVLVDPAWNVLGYLALAAVLVTMPPRYGLLVAATLLGCFVVERFGLGVHGIVFLALQDALTGLALAGIIVLVAFVDELFAARAEVARLAVTAERSRFARDLHDTLGHNLSAMALKSELAARLLEVDRDRSRAEMLDVHTIARESLRDVRTVVKGYRRNSLVRELQGVQSVLVAAGVECVVSALPADLPAPVEEVLAWTVREGATNLLRHSDATRCEITVHSDPDGVRLEMDNDGSRTEPTDAVGGSGLAGLTERLAPLGGVLHAQVTGGRFRLTATIPRTEPGRAA